MSSARRCFALLLTAAAVIAAFPASGHLRFPKFKAERSIEIRLDESPIQVGYRLGLGAKAADDARLAADTDRDGVVGAAEANAAFDARTTALLSHLSVCTGPTLAKADCRRLERRSVVHREAVGWVPGPARHLHFTWSLDVGESTDSIGAVRIEDTFEETKVDITEVEIRVPPALRLESAGADGRDEMSPSFTWIEARRPPGPRIVHAVWPEPARSTWLLVVGLGGVAAVALGLWLRRRRLDRS